VTSDSTIEAILEGAARALARRGAKKLFMSDICEEAGVSRGTLYRYFKSKDDVLESLSQHVLMSMRAVLEEAVRRQPEPQERIRVVLQAMMSFSEEMPYTKAIVEAEPGFALEFFQRTMPMHVSILVDVLGDAVTKAPPVVAGVLTPHQLAELLERLALSTYLIRSDGAARMASTVADTWQALLEGFADEPEDGTRRDTTGRAATGS
jgi:AcrR family transcriptional regulator